MKALYSFAAILVLASCSAPKQTVTTQPGGASLVPDGKLFTAFYQQQAAEYRALCFQGYNVARWRLDEALRQRQSKPLAVITDIDETVLDNSPYAVHQALQNKEYDLESWVQWSGRSEADTLAGAHSFFTYAASKGVEVFYVSNRDQREKEGTLNNLKKYGFPFADEDHLILRQTTSSKEVRRQSVMTTHQVVLLLGDNLADFSALFDKKTTQERLSNTQLLSAEFGKKFIIFPNPGYGDWEGALFNYSYTLTPAEKAEMIRSALKNY